MIKVVSLFYKRSTMLSAWMDFASLQHSKPTEAAEGP